MIKCIPVRYLILLLLSFLCVKHIEAQHENYSVVTITVKNDHLNSLPNAEVVILDTNQYKFSVFTDSNGVAVIKLPINHLFELYSAAFDHYDSRYEVLATDSTKKNIVLQNTEFLIYRKLEPPVIYFGKGSFQLSPEMQSRLDTFAGIFMKYRLLIELAGHTDVEGDEAKNFELSQKRAEAVKSYLEAAVTGRCYLYTQSYGKFRPLYACHKIKCTEKERRLNDRVTIRLIKNIK
jgi:outer membrane protein OmpA-like peptidoglycan-associated protein